MGNIRVIVIDDESLAREITKSYLIIHPEYEIIAECSNGFDAIKKINEEKPDLIFLDIQMPKLTGFEMLELLEEPPIIIFTTAYDQFAIKAFEVNAVDYLLKPFSEQRFTEALAKTKLYIQDRYQHDTGIKNILEHTEKEEKNKILERVVIKEGPKISILPVEEINWIEAQDDYVMIHSEKGKNLKKKTMQFFEEHLDENHFIRIHRSYLINIDFIKHLELYEKDSYRIILKNEKQLPVSKTGLEKLKQIL
jgi:two-component system LytT family response regulator